MRGPSESDLTSHAVKLERATAGDAARAFRLFEKLQRAEAVPEPFRLDEAGFRRTWLGEFQGEIVFAVSGGRDVGFCGCVRDWFIPGFEDALYMSAIYADPSCRCRGLGRALVGELVRQARTLGRARLVWCVRPDNGPGCAFSAALGAVDVGERRFQERGVAIRLRLFALSARG